MIDPATPPSRKHSAGFRLIGMGTELLGAVIAGAAIGWYIDYKFHTRYGLVIGSVIGIVGGLYNLIKQYLVFAKDEQRRSHSPSQSVDHDPPLP